MNYILNKANESKCKNKFIILDCCFSGKFGQLSMINNNSIIGKGLTIISASKDDQSSEESKEIEHGVFTNLMLEGLKGGASDIGGNITPASIYSFVDQSLGAWQQRPVFKTNISQFLPLRTVKPRVDKEILRKINTYFSNSNENYKLDPSFEFTNTPDDNHEIIEPYAEKSKVKIFKELQLL